MTTQPAGCLGQFLRLLGIGSGTRTEVLPYRLRDHFLTKAEFSFYSVLRSAVGDRAVVLCKINLNDLFYVAKQNENQGARNRIDRKHVDFVLCDVKTMQPVVAIELDDRSHERADRRERDGFVDRVFEVAGLALVRIRAQRGYNPGELREVLGEVLGEYLTAK
ncbi:PDDEXK family nuclease [Lacunimicrobium album]